MQKYEEKKITQTLTVYNECITVGKAIPQIMVYLPTVKCSYVYECVQYIMANIMI